MAHSRRRDDVGCSQCFLCRETEAPSEPVVSHTHRIMNLGSQARCRSPPGTRAGRPETGWVLCASLSPS